MGMGLGLRGLKRVRDAREGARGAMEEAACSEKEVDEVCWRGG